MRVYFFAPCLLDKRRCRYIGQIGASLSYKKVYAYIYIYIHTHTYICKICVCDYGSTPKDVYQGDVILSILLVISTMDLGIKCHK